MIAHHDDVACMDQRGDGACVALDPTTLLCSIYASRPQTCRDFARGGTLCRRTLAISRSTPTLFPPRLSHPRINPRFATP
jgi:Fe-S-cluster containining protein